MKKITLIALTLIFTGLSLVITGNVASADSHHHNVPGWGHGDKNHRHSGPPGRTVRPTDDWHGNKKHKPWYGKLTHPHWHFHRHQTRHKA